MAKPPLVTVMGSDRNVVGKPQQKDIMEGEPPIEGDINSKDLALLTGAILHPSINHVCLKTWMES